jgi:riboflavin kinase/FMN adenylyltransferase
MLVTRGLLPSSSRPVALTIGNFDGVHRGHQAILDRLVREARARDLPAAVLTFEPHPREFFSPETAPTRLTSLREKLELLAAYGVDQVHVQRFDSRFAHLTAELFIERVLVQGLRTRWLLIGDDFRFGAKRTGDFDLLVEAAPHYRFGIEAMPTVTDAGLRVSSSAVRDALARGDLSAARMLLGRHYSISGRVVHGAKLGRQLGYATANVQMRHNRPPLTGIFAVRALGTAEGGLPGVASLGFRPTVEDAGRATLEVHLFDFDGDLYGRHLRVEFLHKIRDEAKYPDLDTLKAQIARDCNDARGILGTIAHG